LDPWDLRPKWTLSSIDACPRDRGGWLMGPSHLGSLATVGAAQSASPMVAAVRTNAVEERREREMT
jgi:hypothetical protein